MPGQAMVRASGRRYGVAAAMAVLLYAGNTQVLNFVGLQVSGLTSRDRTCMQAKDKNALAEFLKPRIGKGKERELPSNAEMIGTLKIVYEVALTKPLGIVLTDGPRGPGFGVGVEEVLNSGSAAELFKEVLKGEDSMWIQEGDELEAVNGEPVDGFQDKAVEMIQKSGDEVKLQLSRPRKGFIKVVFPDGKHITSPRAAVLQRLAEKVGYNSGCTCKDGRDEKCWYKDVATGEVYVLPLNVPGLVPSVWRKSGEDGARPGEADYECSGARMCCTSSVLAPRSKARSP
ncbi:unnamed protein product [Durusdinium trenchii]|uniref:PDZ domain-containing protein n=1 Tax=Durusdinium trenchii TaxID=1381693 RepID=A0ABP0R0M9_9DINO